MISRAGSHYRAGSRYRAGSHYRAESHYRAGPQFFQLNGSQIMSEKNRH